MRKSTFTLLSVLFLAFGAFGQKSNKAEELLDAIRQCETCKEVVMVANGVEKSYTGVWFDSMNMENNFITFTKGLHKHHWNPEKVVFIERNDRYVRVWLK